MGRNADRLLSSHPLATKLPSTFSACVFVIFDFRALTSRRAANDETEYASLGASMICSTYVDEDQKSQLCSNTSIVCRIYYSFEVGDLLNSIVSGHLGHLVAFSVYLED
jgi:hypothetical protein